MMIVEIDEDFCLSPPEECLPLELFFFAGSTVKTTLIKHIIRFNALNYHKIYLICSTANLQDEKFPAKTYISSC